MSHVFMYAIAAGCGWSFVAAVLQPAWPVMMREEFRSPTPEPYTLLHALNPEGLA